MIIKIKPGQRLKVEFIDEEEQDLDGQFEIHFDTREYPEQIVIRESAGLEGSIKGGANEVLYIEDFSDNEPKNEDFSEKEPKDEE